MESVMAAVTAVRSVVYLVEWWDLCEVAMTAVHWAVYLADSMGVSMVDLKADGLEYVMVAEWVD